MTATSRVNGHEVYYDERDGKWRFKETGHLVNHEAACSECGKEPCLFEFKGMTIRIDSCIGKIVEALNRGGIKTIASCCGHGELPGWIALDDERELVILQKGDLEKLLGVFNARTIYGERKPK